MPEGLRTLLPLPARIDGDGFHLRPWRRGDGPALFAGVEANRERLSEWLPWPHLHGCVEDSEDTARRFHARWLLRENFAMGVWVGEGLCGSVGVHPVDWDLRRFEIGYWVDAAQLGRGLIRRGSALAAALAFERLGAERVEIRHDERNTRSAAIPRALGFVDEGCLRAALRPAQGVRADVRYWAMTREDYAGAAWREGAAAAVFAGGEEG